jgi:hypothetical protein
MDPLGNIPLFLGQLRQVAPDADERLQLRLEPPAGIGAGVGVGTGASCADATPIANRVQETASQRAMFIVLLTGIRGTARARRVSWRHPAQAKRGSTGI